MKKLIAIMLALLALFVFAACDEQVNNGDNSSESTPTSQTDVTSGGGTTDSSTDEGGNTQTPGGSNDSDPDNSGSGNGGSTSSPDLGTGYMLTSALMSQFEKAQSMKVGIDMTVKAEIDSWYYDYNDTTEAYDIPTNDNQELDADISCIITIAKTENGYDAKVDVDLAAEIDGGKMEYNGTLLYIIDGVMYEYDINDDVFIKSEMEKVDTSELEAIFGELFAGLEISEDDKNQLLNAIGEAAIFAFDISSNKGSLEIDAKPIVNGVLEYIEELDMDKDTLGSLVNDMLALVDETLTAEALLDTCEGMYSLTVEQYLDMMDQLLTEQYGMTVQDVYDTIVSSAEFQTIMTNIMVSEGATADEVAKTLENMANTDIRALIPAETMSQTMYVAMMEMMELIVENESTEPFEYPTMEELFATVEQMLAMTLAQAEENLGIPFSRIKIIASGIKVNELNASCEIKFTGLFKLSSYSEEFNVDMSITLPSEVEGEDNFADFDVFATVKVYDISDEAVVIELPADKEIVTAY